MRTSRRDKDTTHYEMMVVASEDETMLCEEAVDDVRLDTKWTVEETGADDAE